MKWWENILPLQGVSSSEESDLTISYHNRQKKIWSDVKGPDPEKEDKVMLIRRRLSRILFLRKFFKYPISLNLQTINNLGFFRLIMIGFSYIWSSLFPIKKERSLEDFLINISFSSLFFVLNCRNRSETASKRFYSTRR